VIPFQYHHYARLVVNEHIAAGEAAARRRLDRSASSESKPMLCFTLSYGRYVLTALSTVAFKLAAN